MSFHLPDFDTMQELAKNNPIELERLRVAAIEDVIGNAPVELQRRLRGLQFQIDAQRVISRSPMASCLKISEMMHKSFVKLRIALNSVTAQNSHIHDYLVQGDNLPKRADVIPFRL